MATPSKQQMNIYLPNELALEVKHAAIDLNLSVSAFIEEALRYYMAQALEKTIESPRFQLKEE